MLAVLVAGRDAQTQFPGRSVAGRGLQGVSTLEEEATLGGGLGVGILEPFPDQALVVLGDEEASVARRAHGDRVRAAHEKAEALADHAADRQLISLVLPLLGVVGQDVPVRAKAL